MDVFALLAIILFFAAFYRDAELFVILPLTLIILSFLITLFVPGSIVPFIISVAVFLLLMGRRDIPEGTYSIFEGGHSIDVHLDIIETLAKRREKELEIIKELERRISKEPERSVRDYMDSQRSIHYAAVKRINREMGLYCDEIRKNWE